MTETPADLKLWSWAFMLLYVGMMILLGLWGQRRVSNADDFAVARSSYGPYTLAVAFAATTASGASFLGLPGLAYNFGAAALMVGFTFPLGVYVGVYLCQRVVGRLGNEFGNRSIPEFLGDRYQSNAIRIVAALFSLILMFFLAGQLIGGLVMFEVLLGLDRAWALGFTSLVLLIYVSLGGAHADILTDTVQGVLMLLISIGVTWMFFVGFGVVGGFDGMLDRIRELDATALAPFNERFALMRSPWSVVALFMAALPLGMLPHIGNKLWALKDQSKQRQFIIAAFVMAFVFQAMALGGLLSRAVVGDALFEGGPTPNAAIPVLFVQVFPTWLAALLGTAILAAIMSTADGLVVSSSQVFANDLYRRTFAPRWHKHLSQETVDRNVLLASRLGTAFTMIITTVIAWFTYNINIILVTWIGIGGFVSALAGSLVLGLFWKRATAAGALAGFASGAGVFVVLHAKLWPAALLEGTILGDTAWLATQAANPYACSAIAECISIFIMVVVSLYTRPLPEAHLKRVFGT